jgi:hypothetical protein
MTTAQPLAGPSSRPVTVTVLTLLLILQAATALALAGLSIVIAIAGWVSRGRTGSGFADLAAVIAGMMAVFAIAVLALAVLAWMALRGRRAAARWLSLAVFVMPLVGVVLVFLVRSSSAPALVVAVLWAVLGAWLSLSRSTGNWLQQS